jgi:hypothetical protein
MVSPPNMKAPDSFRSLRRPSILLAALCAGALASAQYTEVPATVAPGRFLLETDALSLIIDREGPEKFTGVVAGNVLLTTGLTANWDIQVGAELFVSQRYEQGNFTDRRSGVGDVYVRTKWRFVENEFVSAAILPYAKIPTNSGDVGNDSIEGGVALPWETYLFGGFLTLNSMVDLSLIRNVNDDGYEKLVYASSAASKQLTRFLTLYAELDATKSSTAYPWQTTLGVGAYLTVSDRLSWDFAMYRGLNRNAPDWNPVVRVNYGF